MKIDNNYEATYLNNLKETQKSAQEVETKQCNEEKIEQDKYISSEQNNMATGLYHLEHDQNGNTKILFDAIKKKEVSKLSSDENKTEECTINTDSVDREIEKLKQQKKQLEQQLKRVSGDKSKENELNQKILDIENKLMQKNNDTYRRQNSVIS